MLSEISSPSILQSTHLPSIAHMPFPLCLVMWSFLSLSNLCNLYQDNPCFADTSQKTTPLDSTEKPQICLNQLLAYLYLYLHSSLTGGKQSDQQFCPSVCSGHKAGTIFDSSLPSAPWGNPVYSAFISIQNLAKYPHPLISQFERSMEFHNSLLSCPSVSAPYPCLFSTQQSSFQNGHSLHGTIHPFSFYLT